MSSSYRIALDRWLSQLEVTANTVLDIGGSQLPVKGRTKSWDVQRYDIADLASPHVGSPKPDIILDLNYLSRLSNDRNKTLKYDMVFCLEVFDYVWNPYYAFQNIWRHTKNGGTAYITFPFVYPTHNPYMEDSLRYTEWGIRKLAIATHFKIIELLPRRPETDAVDQLWRKERMRAAKHYDHDVTGWIVKLQKNGSDK